MVERATSEAVHPGVEMRRRATGAKADLLLELTSQLDPGVAKWVEDFIFGQVWTRPGLTFEERMLVTISALAATGHPTLLRNYLHGALHEGIDPRKIHETLVQVAPYCGFPVALEALGEWRSVVEAARKQGVNIVWPGGNGR